MRRDSRHAIALVFAAVMFCVCSPACASPSAASHDAIRYTVLAVDPTAGLVSVRTDDGQIEVLERGKESRNGSLLLRSVEARGATVEYIDAASAERSLWRVDVGMAFTPHPSPPSRSRSIQVIPLTGPGDKNHAPREPKR